MLPFTTPPEVQVYKGYRLVLEWNPERLAFEGEIVNEGDDRIQFQAPASAEVLRSFRTWVDAHLDSLQGPDKPGGPQLVP